MVAFYFPQGVAVDAAFCNRDEERASIKRSIERHEHLVLVAPRRYGKTSLMAQVLSECAFPGESVDFLFTLTQAEVKKLIEQATSKILNQLLRKSKISPAKIIQKIKQFNPKLTLNFLGQSIEISSQQSGEQSISELLLALDQFAAQAKQTCVMVFDEFQQIGALKENHAVEAAIRHAVERSQYITYIFCGSKRHLLNEMFSSKARPLYRLCNLLTIDRISSECYRDFLNKAAKKQWKKILANEVIDEILALTKNHPYYVNALCRSLWLSDSMPVLPNVRNQWHEYVNQQSAWIINDIGNLTLNRKKVLHALALETTDEPQGQAFSKRTELAPSAISKSVEDLQKFDLVYKDKKGYYRILDPAIEYFLTSNQ